MKDILIEKQEREKNCPECGSIVWMNWEESPNFHCEKCEYKTDMELCTDCGNLKESDSELVICDDCWERKMNE